MPTYTQLRQEMTQHLNDARAVLTLAEQAGRALTPAEQAKADQHLAAARELRPRVEQAKADQSTRAAMAELGNAIGLGEPAGTTDDAPGAGQGGVRKSRYASPRGTSSWVKSTVDTLRRVTEASGTKALISGALTVAAPIATGGMVLYPEHPTRVLDLIVDRVPMDGNVFTYLRQTARVDGAEPVADGAVKPTSVYTVTEEEDRARVIAHLSEPVTERLFADYSDLEAFLRLEMEAGVLRALEREIVNGSGTGEHFTGLLNTSGVLAQPYVTSPWVSIRKGLTALEVADEQPTAIVVHPRDAEAFDLAREGADGGWLLASAPDNITTGLPLVRSVAVPVGTAVLGDWRTATLYVREEAKLDMDRSGDLFTRNQVRMRLEGRYGVAFGRPSAFAEVSLTA